MKKETTRYLWERLPEETDKAFNAFICYVGMPPKIRSLLGVAKELYGEEKKSIPGQLTIWANKHRWSERAQALDRARVERDLDLLADKRDEVLLDVWEGLSLSVKLNNQRVKDTLAGMGDLLISPQETTAYQRACTELARYLEQGESPDAVAELNRLLEKEGFGPVGAAQAEEATGDIPGPTQPGDSLQA